MSRSVSIAEARNHLPQLVHDVEVGEQIEITRRGEPVAVLIDIASWRRMRPPKPDLFTCLETYWTSLGPDAEDFDPNQIFDTARDRAPGPDVDLG